MAVTSGLTRAPRLRRWLERIPTLHSAILHRRALLVQREKFGLHPPPQYLAFNTGSLLAFGPQEDVTPLPRCHSREGGNPVTTTVHDSH